MRTVNAASAASEPRKPAFDKANLALRVGSALVFCLFFFTLLYFGEQAWAKLTWLLALSAALVLGVREMVLIARKGGNQPSVIAASITGLGLLLHFYLMTEASDPLPLWLVLVLGGAVIHFGALLFRKDPLDHALSSQAITWMSALYLGLGLGFMQKLFMFNETTLANSNTGARLILALFLIVWLGDTCAYFVGSAFGKHKLAPKVSPKKSWEGAFGNFLGNLIGAFIVRAWICTQWSVVDAIAIALLLGTVGQLGDLVESTWKRSAGVKDSNLGVGIPGHGGILDRLDSLVFAAPALYAYVHYVHGLN
ncbi:MAG: phosphatidate cytidylyltransferase [Firmicutes bacterium]|nr:phosphatidate cytidylyltransferase [Bacillota bacterium]